MKNFLIIILLVAIHFGVFAQNEPFRIDSLPKQGVLIDKGWKFHAGDNPDFAKAEFDDSKWESTDPTKDITELTKIREVGSGWFRLHFKVDTTLKNTIISLMINQAVASEIYHDNKLIGIYGRLSTNPSLVKAYNPGGFTGKNQILHIFTGNNPEQILAVKFSVEPIGFYKKYYGVGHHCMSLTLFKTNETNPNVNYEETFEQRGVKYKGNMSDYFKAGIFFIMCLLHLFFYFSLREKSANLFFFIFCFILLLIFLLQPITLEFVHYVSERIIFFKLNYLLIPIASIFLLLAVYKLFSFQRGVIFILLSFVATIIFILELLQIEGIYFAGYILFIFAFIDVSRLSVKGFKEKKEGSIILLVGSVCFMLSIGAYILTFKINSDYLLSHILALIFPLSIPISICLFLAREFSQTSKFLAFKLIEVERLSTEKQETLLKQNAELQTALLKGQTIERQRVALDLHDNLGSTLSALWLSVDMIDKSKMNIEEKEIHQNLRQNLEKAYNDVRLLSHNLLPEEFEKQGLKTILQGFVRKMNKNSTIKFDLKIDENFGRADNKVEFELYCICLELVNNIIKHSKASEAKIELSRPEKQIKLIVSDNGIGVFKNDSDGKGMKNVKARVESLNGSWELQNIDSQGVSNRVLIPF